MARSKNTNTLARIGIVACLAAMALFGSSLSTYNEDLPMLSRMAAVTSQHYQYVVARGPKHSTCPPSSKLPTDHLVIDIPAIRAHSKERLDHLKQFTRLDYEQYMMEVAGKEHYTLLHWLTSTYNQKDDCRHVADIGTRFVASSLALGATGASVKTFDIPNSQERKQAFRGKSEEEWQTQLQQSGVNVVFYNLDLLAVSDEEFREYVSTWLVVLDTFHKPFSVPFEREFLDRLMAMEPKFEGILMLDDINFNPEMRAWWQELQHTADNRGYVAYDLTTIGHVSGTGLLDFSGKVVIQP